MEIYITNRKFNDYPTREQGSSELEKAGIYIIIQIKIQSELLKKFRERQQRYLVTYLIDAYQKMSKVYDGLMKSGHFSAVQNKEENGDYIHSIGQLVELCEREGFIPRYYTDTPNDKVDQTIADLKGYTKSLIENETNLAQLIEQALIKLEKEKENEDVEEQLEKELETLGEVEELIEEDYLEHNKFLEEERAASDAILSSLLEDGE